MPVKGEAISQMQFAAATFFDFSVYGDLSALNCILRIGTQIAGSREFQCLIQFNKSVFDFYFFHVFFLLRLRRQN